MKVKELKELSQFQESDVVEIKSGATYLLKVPKGLGPDGINVIRDRLASVSQLLNIKVLVMEDDFQMFEIVS